MTNEAYISLFTTIVMQNLTHHHICLRFLKNIETQYKLSKKFWKDADGIITIRARMEKHILENISEFKIDSNLANKPY